MYRRRFLQLAAPTGAALAAGCAGVGSPGRVSDFTDSSNGAKIADCNGDTPTQGGPQSPYDSLTLHQMPGYVTEYAESVIVDYQKLSPVAQHAVHQALNGDEPYRQCSVGQEQTGVMAVFSRIERRWEAAGGESYDHTYLHYEGRYYGITLVQEGDFVRVESIPCTADACPTTPTPPP